MMKRGDLRQREKESPFPILRIRQEEKTRSPKRPGRRGENSQKKMHKEGDIQAETVVKDSERDLAAIGAPK